MSEIVEQTPPSHRDKLIDDVGDWIDQYNIADLVVFAIEDQWGFDPTYEQCQYVWYSVLDRIGDLINECARRIPDPADDD